MRKIFCDRCKKEIKPINTRTLRHTEYRHRVILFKDFLDAINYDHEICEECGNSFYNWFNHPEKDVKDS